MRKIAPLNLYDHLQCQVRFGGKTELATEKDSWYLKQILLILQSYYYFDKS